MGRYLGISRKMMDIMIVEIDLDKDNFISEDEWINQVLKSRDNLGKIGQNTVLNDLYIDTLKQQNTLSENL